MLRIAELQMGGYREVFDCIGSGVGIRRGGGNWRFTRGNRPAETYQRVGIHARAIQGNFRGKAGEKDSKIECSPCGIS